eukprot:TRINITY_DN20686_c0_g1_i1.p1 TRINITY_DN20686_c0_g1~~TRINITY_DN20686_c0_g1_i1.p1  ORF type:complete len:592 (+),score=114.76 TRINITY_DN20686_c0_g1_i1:43-1776(+)
MVAAAGARSRSPLRRPAASAGASEDSEAPATAGAAAESPRKAALPQSLPKGARVQYFLAADPSDRYAPYVCPARCSGSGPRLLQSHGWLDGHLAEAFDAERYKPEARDTWPLVLPSPFLRFTGRFGGDNDNDGDGPNWPAAGAPAVGPRRLRAEFLRQPRTEPPLLSLLFVRWGGKDSVPGPNTGSAQNDGDWGNFGCPASDHYMSAVMERGVMAHPRLKRQDDRSYDFEVFSLFVSNSRDVGAIGTLAPWLAACMKGQKTTSFWMLWPAEWEDCSGSDYAAYVDRRALFTAMRAFEATGVRTGFPHPADQYELITSKSWMATLALQPQAQLPAAVLVSKASVLADAQAAAKQALAGLEFVRSQNPFPVGADEGKGPSAVNRNCVCKGVVKLGWSWEARYVSIFSKGEKDLAAKLTAMMTHPGCHASSCIVQEWVDFDFEMRLYFLPPAGWTPAASRLKPTRVECNAWSGTMENGERRDFHRLSKENVLEYYWQKDEEAYKSAKKQAITIAQFLLGWLLVADAQPVPMIRLDFMLLRQGPGKARVVFGEYCEMGACCLSWQEGPPTIWRAALDAALR